MKISSARLEGFVQGPLDKGIGLLGHQAKESRAYPLNPSFGTKFPQLYKEPFGPIFVHSFPSQGLEEILSPLSSLLYYPLTSLGGIPLEAHHLWYLLPRDQQRRILGFCYNN